MSEAHVADPEFVRFLGWQLEHELRRRTRLGAPPRRRAPRLLGLALLVLGSGVLGAGGVMAAEWLQDAPQRALQLERAQVAAAAANERLRLAQEDSAQVEQLVQAAAASAAEQDQAQEELEQAQTEARLRALELEEVQASGVAPSDALGAARVHGRDFVGERLQVRLAAAASAVPRAEARLQRARTLYEQGFTAQGEVRQLVGCRDVQRLAVDRCEQLLHVRAACLSGDLSALEAERAAAAVMARARVAEYAAAETTTRAALEQARQLRDAGVLGESELRASERAARAAESACRMAEVELKLIEDRRGR